LFDTHASVGCPILHAAFSTSTLLIWAEDPGAWFRRPSPAALHPFAASHEQLLSLAAQLDCAAITPVDVHLRLPAMPAPGDALLPAPSSKLARTTGIVDLSTEGLTLSTFSAPALAAEATGILDLLDRLEDAEGNGDFVLAGSVGFYISALRVARHLLAQQRFVPMLWQLPTGELTGSWHPWLNDAQTAERVAALVDAMPPSARAIIDDRAHDAARIVEGFLGAAIDAQARATLTHAEMFDTVSSRDPLIDGQIAWLHGLLGPAPAVPTPAAQRTDIVRRVRHWIGALEERGESAEWRLLLRVREPIARTGESAESLDWAITFHLQDADTGDLVIDGEEVWMLSGESITLAGKSLSAPQELLLAELARAARLYPALESVLDESEPIRLLVNTNKAYEFLRQVRPILLEQGFGVDVPDWWDSPSGRLGARLRIESESLESLMDPGDGSAAVAGPQLGLSTLVSYHWEIAIGDTTLSLHEFEQYANRDLPLVQIGGRWVEIRPEDVTAAIRFIRENPGGEMQLSDAMRLAYGSDTRKTGIPVVGLEATGWVSEVLGAGGDGARAAERIPDITPPAAFQGTLRPYQQRGLSWLVFLERFGLGACLADDMGLGKTIQLLALLLHERELAGDTGTVEPTLLIAPMSVVGNWIHEVRRFAPQLKVLVHHGLERLTGDTLVTQGQASDIVLTTYALAHRDRDTLQRITWGRIVLDEAQYIKNPAAKQSQAVRSFVADRRVALTGTPVENRLSELWSIMDFLNPGYLGGSAGFRKRFSVPIERYRDQMRARQLRGLVQPFVLRRVKSDPAVVADLPEKLESREYAHLTSEQATLYESCVKRMLADVEQSEGISRRGVVLAALIRLKQICNHPSQLLKDHDFNSGITPDPARSGKCVRLLEMLDEVLAEGDQALIFTQFRQMGHLLAAMLERELDREILFLHGGTPQAQRQKLVDTFQQADGKRPILILSLKAGGVGLNLTAATHVFHFDRWWNPAVENQATDRAYRIGQTRTVQVHKFVVRGTLEERIDEMIESKTELAEKIIGAGERWLTELDTDQLRDILTLRADAIGDEGE
jgi:hypothetical protein